MSPNCVARAFNCSQRVRDSHAGDACTRRILHPYAHTSLAEQNEVAALLTTLPHMSVMPVVTGFSTKMPTRWRSGLSTASGSPSMMAWGFGDG